MMAVFFLVCAHAEPSNVRLTYNHKGNTQIHWETVLNKQTDKKSELYYEQFELFSDSTDLHSDGVRVKVKSTGTGSGHKYRHSVTVKHTEPETMYLYQVGRDDKWSPVYSFLGEHGENEHYPVFAVAGGLGDDRISNDISTEIIGASFIKRLDGIILFGEVPKTSVFSLAQANIPVITVPTGSKAKYHSIKYANTYLILIRSAAFDSAQEK